MTQPATPDTTPTVPAGLLRDVEGVLAGATEQILTHGWRRPTLTLATPENRAYTITDALYESSLAAAVGERAHVLAFAAAAMAIELHVGVPAHAFLHADADADEYLSPQVDDARLHDLDGQILERYNVLECAGADDAYALLRVAFENAEQVIAAQLAHRPQGPR